MSWQPISALFYLIKLLPKKKTFWGIFTKLTGGRKPPFSWVNERINPLFSWSNKPPFSWVNDRINSPFSWKNEQINLLFHEWMKEWMNEVLPRGHIKLLNNCNYLWQTQTTWAHCVSLNMCMILIRRGGRQLLHTSFLHFYLFIYFLYELPLTSRLKYIPTTLLT